MHREAGANCRRFAGLGRLIAATVLLGSMGVACADPLDDLFNDKPAAWNEVEPALPAYPSLDHLLGFLVTARSAFSYGVDPASITIGPDGVVHYTFVSVSRSGAKNVSFEGMRCATRERRTYAYGRNDGTWMKATSADWNAVMTAGKDAPHQVLFSDFVCPLQTIPKSPDEVIARLRTADPNRQIGDPGSRQNVF